MSGELTGKQEKAFRIASKILEAHFNTAVILCDSIEIDGGNITRWTQHGNINAALGLLQRYTAAALFIDKET